VIVDDGLREPLLGGIGAVERLAKTWCRRRRARSSSRLVAIFAQALFDREALEMQLVSAPRAPPAGAVPGSLTCEREEAIGGTIRRRDRRSGSAARALRR
jgi:hypothetical protein